MSSEVGQGMIGLFEELSDCLDKMRSEGRRRFLEYWEGAIR